MYPYLYLFRTAFMHGTGLMPWQPTMDEADISLSTARKKTTQGLALVPSHVCREPQNWVSAREQIVSLAPRTPLIPLTACGIAIITPLALDAWERLLTTYPNAQLARFLLRGILEGFHIGYNPTLASLRSAKSNMRSAHQHPEVVSDYLSKEVAAGRVAGPCHRPLAPYIHTSRFGVIEKPHQPGKWRLILDLSHPKARSVNTGVDKSLCSMSYITIDEAVRDVIRRGQGTLLAKIDVKSAFRLIPVHPCDRYLLGMEWQGMIYVDTCLPFGLRSAPKLFNILADALEWILKQQRVTFVVHYLDDFLTTGSPDSSECKSNLDKLITTCSLLGIPLATEKIRGPATSLEFLGIELDSMAMEARLSSEKIRRVRCVVHLWLPRRRGKKRDVLSILGLLQHAALVVRPGRTFMRRMFNTVMRVRDMDHFVHLNKDFRSNLHWWQCFLESWNGASFFALVDCQIPSVSIQMDASGNWGCGASFAELWFQWQWPQRWAKANIMAKELVPIVLACAVWGPLLRRKVVLFQCNNMAVVAAISKGTAKEATVMHLLRCLWFFVAHFEISLITRHIPGVTNTAADHLSHDCLQLFFSVVPQAHRLPSPLPKELLEAVSLRYLDWISPSFRSRFNTIIDKVWRQQHSVPTNWARSASLHSATRQRFNPFLPPSPHC